MFLSSTRLSSSLVHRRLSCRLVLPTTTTTRAAAAAAEGDYEGDEGDKAG